MNVGSPVSLPSTLGDLLAIGTLLASAMARALFISLMENDVVTRKVAQLYAENDVDTALGKRTKQQFVNQTMEDYYLNKYGSEKPPFA